MDIEDLKPCIPFYGPSTQRSLQLGQVKLWCTCGLSKSQPWCDNSHKGTPFKPLKWVVPKSQTLYSICCCKYTKSPPYCDANHIHIPLQYIENQKKCSQDHTKIEKMCTKCGFVLNKT